MIKEIEIFEANARFSEIVEDVRDSGQPIRVTNRGEKLVDIVPVSQNGDRRRSKGEAFALLCELRRELPKTTLDQIRGDIAEGRR